ncbi:MAG: TIM barrel protein [Candidatus Thermoplasmatota archaeon]|nr:TIM barrel protein [Candidatus Thermoplasmatota archaeon]
MIRIGQAGIPLSCKGRTNKDGLVYTKEILDLNAMEIQFVRGLYVMEDEEAEFMKEYSTENDVELHVHAPYYINFADDDELDLSFEKALFSAKLADKMGAETVVLHPGYYGDKNEKKTLKNITKNIKKLQRVLKKEKIKTKMGIETMGKRKVFGTLDEVIDVCSNVKNVVPIINVAHIHARNDGSLKKQDDFEEIFEKLEKLKLKQYIIHVTGVLYENGSEQYHLPVKKGDMPLTPLIDVILENNYNVTLISESPLLEHDAVYMRLQVEKAIMKRTGGEEADYRDIEKKKWKKS